MADDVEVKFGASLAGLTNGVDAVKEKIEELAGPLAHIQEAFAGVAEALVAAFAVEKVAEFVEHIAEMGAQVEHATHALGMTAEQVSTLNVAFEAMGLSADGGTRMLERLERNMVMASDGASQQAAAFKALGISVTDAAGHLKSADEILGEIADRFKQTADGPTKTAIAIALLGRAGAEMIPFLDRGRQGLDEFKKTAEETGTVITGPMAEGMENTVLSINRLGLSFKGIGITVFEAFKPAIDATISGIAEMVIGFNEGLKSAGILGGAFGLLVNATKAVVAIVATLSAGLQELWQVIAGTVEVMNATLKLSGQLAGDAFRLNFSKAKADALKGADDINAIMAERATKFAAVGAEYQKTLQSLFGAAEHGEEAHGDHKPELPAMQTGGTSQIDLWKNELQKKLIADQNFFGDSKKTELAFWQSKVQLTAEGSKEWLQVQTQVYQLTKQLAVEDLQAQLASMSAKQAAVKNNYAATMAIEQQKLDLLKKDYGEDSRQFQDELRRKEEMARQHAQELQRIELAHGNAQREVMKLGLDQEKQVLEQSVAIGQSTNARKFTALQQVYEKEYQLELASLTQEHALSGLTETQAAAIDDKMLVLKAKHEADMQKLTRQSVQAQQQEYQQFFNAMGRGFDTAVSSLLRGNTTITQAVQKGAQTMLMSFVQMCEQRVTRWLATQAMETLATLTGTATRTTAETAAAATSAAAEAATAKTGVMQHAYSAAAAVYDDVAQIPYVGWVLAPPAAAAAFAAVAAFGGGIPSAAGGYDVPADTMSFLHKNEMVLPASIAQPLKSAATSGGIGGGGAAPTISYTVQALDAQSVAAMMNQHAKVLATAVGKYMRLNPSTRPAY